MVLRKWFAEYRATRKCRCGESHPACLDFHHHNPHQYKKVGIGELVNRGVSFERLKLELSRCSVLCANCHRKLHAIRREYGEEGYSSRGRIPVTDLIKPNALSGDLPPDPVYGRPTRKRKVNP